ncbi:MAG: alpha-L-fucosidase [Opitutales bacterium]|nr:alpha-L-fucosidase [Opitutales bacterium]
MTQNIPAYIEQFEKNAFGLFLHWGLYSHLRKGEWVSHHHRLDRNKYNTLMEKFTAEAWNPRETIRWAKSNGIRYTCLTTRHHDGFSLYDTRGLNTFDAPHSAAGRDLVAEFVDACRAEKMGIFFYHTTLDWNEKSFDEDWDSYLEYLNQSVKILCTQYGKIDGLWFDGNWSRRERDWKEDALYGMIRKHQPECMIINNSSIEALGDLNHPALDAVTFEQGKPTKRTHKAGEKYTAAEMCETINSHWGDAQFDYSHKSPAELISSLAACRRYRANFLLNIGPLADGSLPSYEKAAIDLVGKWAREAGEVLYEGLPVEAETCGDDFVLSHQGDWYYFSHYLPITDNMHLAEGEPRGDGWQTISAEKMPTFQKATWLDNAESLDLVMDSDKGLCCFRATPNPYGSQRIVRIARLSKG